MVFPLLSPNTPQGNTGRWAEPPEAGTGLAVEAPGPWPSDPETRPV